MYSPDGGGDAFDANAKIDTAQMSKSRFIIQRQETIYAGRKILQIGVGDGCPQPQSAEFCA
jgi:hypothetical protein